MALVLEGADTETEFGLMARSEKIGSVTFLAFELGIPTRRKGFEETRRSVIVWRDRCFEEANPGSCRAAYQVIEHLRRDPLAGESIAGRDLKDEERLWILGCPKTGREADDFTVGFGNHAGLGEVVAEHHVGILRIEVEVIGR